MTISVDGDNPALDIIIPKLDFQSQMKMAQLNKREMNKREMWFKLMLNTNFENFSVTFEMTDSCELI